MLLIPDEDPRRDPNAPTGRLLLTRVEWLLFLTLWLIYGCCINSQNLEAFGLQQAGVEAYVERHHLYLEGSSVARLQVQPVVDAFVHDGHIYPAKQPGQFMAGACAYYVLHFFGLSYAGNYLLTAALVTFLTASLVTAASAVAVFRIARGFVADQSAVFSPLLATLSYGLGSTVFAYSGLAWHDTLATGYLTIALYFVIRLTRNQDSDKSATIAAGCAGTLLGLTIATSMLAFLPAVALATYCGVFGWKRLPALLVGTLAGLAPLLIYNAVCFGNPLSFANVVGNYGDTFFRPGWENFVGKLRLYGRLLTVYVPIAWVGLVGLAFFPGRLRREQCVLLCMTLALVAYITNIEAWGTCQYGPRYLLPAMPLLALGLAGFSRWQADTYQWRLAAAAAALSLAGSVFINLMGALRGAMLCDFPQFAAMQYFWEFLNGPARSYPLASILSLPMVMSVAFLGRALVIARSTHAKRLPHSRTV